ncbi:uncharacterized protein LOC117546053 [Gymnodraco acuticeps]|uniref:Uncharacterized protein LOC117546053 n=1 Tax=Gymnodraco acuticeps TaxID=8218 RepID=A0A6P8U5I8_GYMAC|nr:uncharacterized protein LOC117546053 [Gymnodraco acuticeps]
MIQHKVSDEDIDKNEAEDKQQRMSSQSGLEDDQLSDEDIDKNEAEDKQQRMSSQSGLEDDQLSDEDIDKNEAEDKQQRMSSQSGLEDDQLSDEDIDKNEAEDKQQRMSSQSGLEDDQLSDEDIDKNEAETEEQNLQRGAQDVNKNTGTKTHWRKLPHNSNAVLIHLKAMKDFIKECRIPDMEEGDKLGDSPLTQEEDDEERRNAHTAVGRSPFTYEFRKVMEEVQGELEKEEVETPQDENPYFCPGIVDVLFDNYLGMFPLWSGLLLGNLKRYATDTEEDTFGQSKTRDTNCHVERWFGIVKHSILKKQRRLRPATFIRKMYGSLQGRYREHIMAHHLSEQLLLKTLLPKDISQSKEGWAKRDGAKPRTSSSKYYTTPDILPVPKRAKLTLNTGEDIQSSTDVENSSNPTSKGSKPATEVDALWTCKPTEVVVAVVRHAEEKHNFTLRHREFQSLRPDELIIGEVMECYIRGILNLKDNAGRLYLLDHYTMGVILHGTREQIARQELKKVTFDLYDGAIGFVNIRNVHWKFVYLHALSNHIYVVDPLQGSNEVEDSRKVAYKFGEYFKMRRNRLGKEDWVSIKWQPGKITHTFQKDATSCGAFVMQMAEMTVKEFPKIPKTFHIKSSQHLRRDMAEDILRGSVSKDDFCSFCGIEDLPTNESFSAILAQYR